MPFSMWRVSWFLVVNGGVELSVKSERERVFVFQLQQFIKIWSVLRGLAWTDCHLNGIYLSKLGLGCNHFHCLLLTQGFKDIYKTQTKPEQVQGVI